MFLLELELTILARQTEEHENHHQNHNVKKVKINFE